MCTCVRARLRHARGTTSANPARTRTATRGGRKAIIKTSTSMSTSTITTYINCVPRATPATWRKHHGPGAARTRTATRARQAGHHQHVDGQEHVHEPGHHYDDHGDDEGVGDDGGPLEARMTTSDRTGRGLRTGGAEVTTTVTSTSTSTRTAVWRDALCEAANWGRRGCAARITSSEHQNGSAISKSTGTSDFTKTSGSTNIAVHRHTSIYTSSSTTGSRGSSRPSAPTRPRRGDDAREGPATPTTAISASYISYVAAEAMGGQA